MNSSSDRIYRGLGLAVIALALAAGAGTSVASRLCAVIAAVIASWLYLRDQRRTSDLTSRLRRAGEDAHRFAFLVENASDAIGIYDVDGHGLHLNASGKKLVGIDNTDDFRQVSINDNFFPEDREFVTGQVVPRALRDGASNSEVRFRHSKTGATIWMDLSVLVIRKDDGSVAGIATIGRDISERRQAREEIAASQRFLRSSLDSLSSQIAVLDETGVILAVNDAWRRFAEEHEQHSTSFGVGAQYFDLWAKAIGIRDSHVSDANQLVRDVMQGTRPNALMEYPALSDADEELWFQMRVTRFPEPGPARVVVAHEHITPRVRSETTLRKRSEQLRQTAKLATELSLLHDVESILGVVTEGARLIIGAASSVAILSTRLLTGTDHIVRSPSSGSNEVRDPRPLGPRDTAMIAHVRHTNRPLRLTEAALVTDPKWNDAATGASDPFHGWLGVPLIGISGANAGTLSLEGEPAGTFTIDDEAVLVQIAQMAVIAIENARLYEALRKTDRQKDEFLATLAHELRNPLAPIRFWLEILKIEFDPTSIERARTTIDRQVTQLVRLIDDLLDISRISFDKLELHKERIDLAQVIESAVETNRPAIDGKKHRLVLNVPNSPITLDADPARLSQILANLLNNASKYTAPGGRIEVRATIDASTVVITIADNGMGIPAEILPNVFDRFMQSGRARSHSEGGLGIGLSLVRRLTEMHGGSVIARSAGPDHGSEFEVRLPLATTLKENGTEKHPLSGTGEPAPKPLCRILVVDDNHDATEGLTLLLRAQGHDCKIAHNGLDALRLAEEFRPDIVFLDIGLPGMNGLDVARRIRLGAWGSSMTLVAVTGWGQDSDRKRSKEAGFDHHMVKPVDLGILHGMLSTCLGR